MCFSFKLNLPPTWITPKKHYLSARFGFEYLKYPPCPSPQMGIFLICASRTWTILVWKKKRKSTSREVLMHILAQLSLFRASKYFSGTRNEQQRLSAFLFTTSVWRMLLQVVEFSWEKDLSCKADQITWELEAKFLETRSINSKAFPGIWPTWNSGKY